MRSCCAVIGSALLGLVLAGCRPQSPQPADLVSRVTAARAAKDQAFQKGSDPIPDGRKAQFLPLAYFPIDPAYDVAAALKPASDSATMLMPTSTGGERQMRRVGTLEFTLKGQPLTLTAFVEVGATDMNRLFVPFTDMTSGTETYPGGRYMDLERTPTGIYAMDFNSAYHPYCYYNAAYDCPYPPSENRLKTPIHAGERLKR